MSDDGDEFGGLAPTTPAVRVKKSTTSRATKPNSRSEAGPSVKPKNGRKNVPISPSDHSEVEEVDPFDFTKQDDNDDHEHLAAPVAARAARKGQAARTETPVVNGRSTTKGKSKPNSSQKRTAPEPMNVDPIEVPDERDDEQGAAADIANTINTAGRHKRTNPTTTRPGKGEQVLAEQLRRAEEQVKTLSSQLEELLQVRETEPEQLLKQQEIQYESQLQAQQALIQELHSLLGSKEPMMGPANANVLNLLTREAADEEMRALQKEVSRWRDVATEKQREVERRDERIALLEQREKELRFELDNEINRSAALNAKLSRREPLRGGGPVGRPGGVEDPRHAEVLRFYEDLSNLLVPNMKAQPGKYLGLEDWVLSCIYTFNDDEAPDQENAPKKSLNFTLRCCYEAPGDLEPDMITSKDQLVPTVHFTPLELDKESPDFVDRLDFLGSPFSFGRNQLPLFLRTIYQRMKEAVLDGADNDDEDSVEIVEET